MVLVAGVDVAFAVTPSTPSAAAGADAVGADVVGGDVAPVVVVVAVLGKIDVGLTAGVGDVVGNVEVGDVVGIVDATGFGAVVADVAVGDTGGAVGKGVGVGTANGGVEAPP